MKPLHRYTAHARARVAAFLALAMVFSLLTVGAGTAQAADHTLFESMNADKVVPEFTINVDGQLFANQNTNYVVARDGALWDGADRLRFVGYDSPNYAFLEDPNWHQIEAFEMEDLIKSVAQSNSNLTSPTGLSLDLSPVGTAEGLVDT